MSNVVKVDFKKAKDELQSEAEFVKLLERDIQEGYVEKIPENVFNRISALKHKALIARQNNELLEM